MQSKFNYEKTAGLVEWRTVKNGALIFHKMTQFVGASKYHLIMKIKVEWWFEI